MDAALRDRVLETLWPPGAPPGTHIWAILDAARDERIYSALMFSRLDYLCLYSGNLPDALKRTAPYLVELDRAYTFTRPLIEMGWGNSWGVFLRINDAGNLRHHLRAFLRVQDESGRKLIFRYYDPRVLRAYLPTCNTNELKTVYGPIGGYLVEGEAGESLIEFEFDGRRLSEHRTSLCAPGQPGLTENIPHSVTVASNPREKAAAGEQARSRLNRTVLVIREEQIAALQVDTDMRWYEVQLSGLYPHFAEAPAQQRLRWIREGVERAVAAKLGRSDFFQFLCFEQTFHPGCLEEADFEWARKLLTQDGKLPGECMKELRHESIRRLLQLEAELEQSALQQLEEAEEGDGAADNAADDEEISR